MISNVFYTDPQLKGLHFGGAINKYNSFQVVLKYLELTADRLSTYKAEQ